MRETIEKVSDEGLNNEKEVFDLPIEERVDCEDHFIDIIVWTIVLVSVLVVNKLNQSEIWLCYGANARRLDFGINS